MRDHVTGRSATKRRNGQSAMRKQKPHLPEQEGVRQPGPTIAITLANDEIRWEVQGEGPSQSAAFNLPVGTLGRLKQDYIALVNALGTRGDGGQYKRLEKELGEELAGFLLRRGDRDNELATELNRCLSRLGKQQYLRLLLRFEDPNLARLPWELTLWQSPATGREICLGRHGDVALSRLARARSKLPAKTISGLDRILSILNIGTELNGRGVFDRTSDFIRRIDDHIPQVHTASLQLAHLKQYWSDCRKLLGRDPEIDIVHWNGHGSTESVTADSKDGSSIAISAGELIARTQGAFLYVVHSCHSGAELPASGDDAARYDTFSSALLDHGASAVLGMHGGVDVAQFEYLPILYALLVQGLPLDYCVQFMRRFFGNFNADHQNGPYEPWYKLLLQTSNTSYLDGKPTVPTVSSSSEVLLLEVLVPQYAQGLEAPGHHAPVNPVASMDGRHADAGMAQAMGFNPLATRGDGLERGSRVTSRTATDRLLRRLYDTAQMK